MGLQVGALSFFNLPFQIKSISVLGYDVKEVAKGCQYRKDVISQKVGGITLV